MLTFSKSLPNVKFFKEMVYVEVSALFFKNVFFLPLSLYFITVADNVIIGTIIFISYHYHILPVSLF